MGGQPFSVSIGLDSSDPPYWMASRDCVERIQPLEPQKAGVFKRLDSPWNEKRRIDRQGHLEPPREKWRLQAVRGWSNDKTGEVSSGDSRTGGTPCAGAPGRVPVTVGGDQLDRHEVRNDARDAAQVGAAG